MLTMNVKKLQYFLVRIPIIYLYSATMLTITFIAVAWWYFIYSPINRAIDRAYDTVGQFYTQQRSVKKIKQDILNTQRTIKQLESDSKQQSKNTHDQLVCMCQTALAQQLTLEQCRILIHQVSHQLR